MCIGVPLQVLDAQGSHAWCEADGQRERLDMMLVGAQPAGTWVLAFNGAARQVLSEAEAAYSRAGRNALAAVLRGESDIDAFFADLIGREPTLPSHLQPVRADEP
jgi:hydrogenase expression/formation protein HypC